MTGYHDYWRTKDGRLVRDFQGMYENFAAPWHQDKQEHWPEVRLGIELLREHGPFEAIVDLAAGTGHFLDILGRHLGAPGVKLIGYDIAELACQVAAKNFPHAKFTADDLREPGRCGAALPKDTLWVIRATFWYLHPEIEQSVRHLPSRVAPGGLLYVAHNFPDLKSDFVGKDVLPSPQALLDLLSVGFVCERSLWYENQQSGDNDHWLMALLRRR